MTAQPFTFGLTMANRGVTFGATTARELLDLGQMADGSGIIESIWVGDTLLSSPRIESVSLLNALAGRTEKVRLGTACMSSFALRDPVLLAFQWASLDQLSGGRTVLVVCSGANRAALGPEFRQYGVPILERVERMVEAMQVVRRLWAEEQVTFEGKFYHLHDVGIGVHPEQRPGPPLWLASNATLEPGMARTLRRVGEQADGWITGIFSGDPPAVFASQWARVCRAAEQAGRDPARLGNIAYLNVNVNEDAKVAFEESRRFLERYYGFPWSDEALEASLLYGPPEACAAKLQTWVGGAAHGATMRITSWSQPAQLRRVIEEVLPLVRR